MDKTVSLSKANFEKFFSALNSDFAKIFAPVKVSKQSFAFKEVNRLDDIAFDAIRTILPPKKFFFKQQETLIQYNEQELKTVLPEPERFVLFGVHPCDLAGLGVIDQIYRDEPEDPHYIARRESALIIGYSCMPDKHCFCKSMGTDSPNKGYDLFLTELDSSYFIQIKNERGGTFIDRHKELFDATKHSDTERFKNYWIKRDQAFDQSFDSSNLETLMDLEWDNQVWEDLGNRCLSCGNCTPVCPTCYCFDVFDVPSLHAQSGERVREWDSCQFVGFAKVAGPHNFRPGPVDRLKFWYRHKLHGFEDAYEMPTCVGCGRCTVSCPSGIDDIINVVLRLQGKPSLLITDNKDGGS